MIDGSGREAHHFGVTDTGIRLLGPDGAELPGRARDTEPAPPPTEPDHPIPEPPELPGDPHPVFPAKAGPGGVLVPATREEAATRPWHDWGKDTGPRLRVKGWGAIEPETAPPLPGDPDPGDVREAHLECRRAIDEGDDAALVKLFPDVLDELHSAAPGAPPIPPLDWSELEPALIAEWREWGAAHAVKGRSIAFKHTEDGAAHALIQLDDGLPYRITSDPRSVRTAWRGAKGHPRRAAATIVAGATAELHRARSSEVTIAT